MATLFFQYHLYTSSKMLFKTSAHFFKTQAQKKMGTTKNLPDKLKNWRNLKKSKTSKPLRLLSTSTAHQAASATNTTTAVPTSNAALSCVCNSGIDGVPSCVCDRRRRTASGHRAPVAPAPPDLLAPAKLKRDEAKPSPPNCSRRAGTPQTARAAPAPPELLAPRQQSRSGHQRTSIVQFRTSMYDNRSLMSHRLTSTYDVTPNV